MTIGFDLSPRPPAAENSLPPRQMTYEEFAEARERFLGKPTYWCTVIHDLADNPLCLPRGERMTP